jgi:lipopolysaccharide transport system permease protein
MDENYITETSVKQEWDREVKPQTKIFDLHLKEVWHYRDLVMLFVWRDFVAQYKQTVLGPLWQFIQPVLTTFIFIFLFNKIANIPTDGIAPVAFYLAGITFWNYFSNCILNISNTFVNNAFIFGKVYFPRLVLPLSIVISNMVRFGLQFGLLVIIMVYYHFNGYQMQITINLLLIPLLLIQMAALSLGLGIIISSITTKYRDFNVLIAFAIQLMMYATPVVYPLSYIKKQGYAWLIDINPLTSIIEAFRLALFNQGTVEFFGVVYSVGFTIVALVLGVIFFNRAQKTFIDTV